MNPHSKLTTNADQKSNIFTNMYQMMIPNAITVSTILIQNANLVPASSWIFPFMYPPNTSPTPNPIYANVAILSYFLSFHWLDIPFIINGTRAA